MGGTFIIPPGGSTANTIAPNLAPVLDNTIATPPVSPNDGDSYIIAATATGVWTGLETQIATWDGSAWVYYIPVEDDTTTVTTGTNAGKVFKFNTGAWTEVPASTAENTPFHLQGTTIDAGANKTSAISRTGGVVVGGDGFGLFGHKFRIVGASRQDFISSRNGVSSTNDTSRTNKWFTLFRFDFNGATAMAEHFTILFAENGAPDTSGHHAKLDVTVRKVSGTVSASVFIDQTSKDYDKFVNNFDILYNSSLDRLTFYYRPTKDTSNSSYTILSNRGGNIASRLFFTNTYLNVTTLAGEVSNAFTKQIVQTRYVADLSGTYEQELLGPVYVDGKLKVETVDSGSTATEVLMHNSATKEVESSVVLTAYISDAPTQALLEDVANWDINGVYTGTAITGTFMGQKHYNGDYFFEAVDNNLWIRLIRG
jgi:hypothetical protein